MSEERIYHIEAPIGRGGFGTVYRARLQGRAGFSRMVALKVLNPIMQDIEDVASRLRDEARILGLVRHRSIVQVDSLIVLAGRWTVVMELVEGVSLSRILKAGKPVPPGPALEIVGEVAGALHAAWSTAGPDGSELHLLHRDIKPSNIQVTPLGEVKVLDFGIAKADFDQREALTSSMAFGTIEYMSPERLDFIDSPAGDVYALGVVLFELLCGESLGRTSANVQRHQRHVAASLQKLVMALPRADDAIIGLVASMLAYDPQQRPTARQIERLCARVRAVWRSDLLHDWAEDTVPPLMQMIGDLPDDELSGASFLEQHEHPVPTDHLLGGGAASGFNAGQVDIPPVSGQLLSAPVASEISSEELTPPGGRATAGAENPQGASQHSAARGRTISLMAAVLAVVGVLVLLLIVQGWGSNAPQVEPEPVAAVVDMARLGSTALADVLEPAPEAESPTSHPPSRAPSHAARVKPWVPPQADPVLEADEGTAAAPKQDPAPAPTVSAEPDLALASAAESAPAGFVRVEGDAQRVVFLSGAMLHSLPGSVPPGTYTIQVTFPNRGTLQSGMASVLDGATITLSCKERFGRCAVR